MLLGDAEKLGKGHRCVQSERVWIWTMQQENEADENCSSISC